MLYCVPCSSIKYYRKNACQVDNKVQPNITVYAKIAIAKHTVGYLYNYNEIFTNSSFIDTINSALPITGAVVGIIVVLVIVMVVAVVVVVMVLR